MLVVVCTLGTCLADESGTDFGLLWVRFLVRELEIPRAVWYRHVYGFPGGVRW